MSTGELITTPSDGGLIITPAIVEQVQRLANISRDVVTQLNATEDSTVKSFIIAEGLMAVQDALTPELMERVMRLMNNPLGFVTDKKPGDYDKNGKPVIPYTQDQVKPIVTEALVRGLRLNGNEWNILVGNLYVAQKGIMRLVMEYPGITDLDVSEPTLPRTVAGGAVVGMTATWKLNGKPDELDCRGDFALPVRVNAGMGALAIQGKAKRQFYNRIWERLVRCDQMRVNVGELGETDLDEPIDETEAQAEALFQPPSALEQYQHQIAECQTQQDCTYVDEALKNSKDLTDLEKGHLREDLEVKSRRILERETEGG